MRYIMYRYYDTPGDAGPLLRSDSAEQYDELREEDVEGCIAEG